jgi:hypothetical protein
MSLALRSDHAQHLPVRPVLLAMAAAGALAAVWPAAARASCAAPVNAIEAENCLAGSPQSEWDLPGARVDSSVEGFATDISVNRGQTLSFKVRTAAASWRIRIYRLGWYGGSGARLVTTVLPSVATPQSQPACLSDAATGLVDCGNWAVSASWAVPATATSGLYVGKLVRDDTGGASHIVFTVRDDASTSAVFFQSSDTTWQAYNHWGGRNLYGCGGFDLSCRASKVSYNRPFITREFGGEQENWLFNAEYPLIRWLERNAYDVSYTTATDSHRRGALIRNHRVWISNGHDEYWSAEQRAAVEAARDAGVNLAFFSSNKIFWKVRREPSIAAGAAPDRTLVCYKETHAGAKIDPLPGVWTGTWRDARFSPPADGGRPENALSGTIFMINAPYQDDLRVPSAIGRFRFWRNTRLASLPAGAIEPLAPATLGVEVDVDLDNGFRPPGLFGVTENPITTSSLYLLDNGSTYGAGSATHKVTLYRHASGALVWAAGSYQWAWGLDGNHDRSSVSSTTDAAMQQATVNLFADMGVQPGVLQAGLVPAAASSDLTAPISVIGSPLPGATVPAGTIVVSGTASDLGGGVVAGVEVSTDGGATWHPASGRESWTYTFSAASGSRTIRTRAVDDSGILEAPGPGTTITVGAGGGCVGECSLWSLATVPGATDGGPDASVELGVRFVPGVAGAIRGIRFYKSALNTGTHVANLWTASGTLLASATFSGETASGWQEVRFPSPVAVTAGATYVASYLAPNGHYAADVGYFEGGSVSSPPLQAPASTPAAPNGVYRYGATSGFPTQTWNATNYWVDVVFAAVPAAPLVSIAVAPAAVTIAAGTTRQLVATGTYGDGSTRDVSAEATWTSSSPVVATVAAGGLVTSRAAGVATVTAAVGAISGGSSVTVTSAPLAVTTTSLPGGTVGTPYSATLAATGGTTPYAWTVTGALPAGLTLDATSGVVGGTPTAAGSSSFTAVVTDAAAATASRALAISVAAAPTTVSLWSSTAAPGLADGGADSPVELGVRFRADVAGQIAGIRFYKSAANVGTHVGSLWSSTGTRLAFATFASETASGWQTVTFATPVTIQAGTYYVASYHCTTGHYAADLNFFASAGLTNGPLTAPANGVAGGNGVFGYGAAGTFPTQVWNAANYWVDVLFAPAPPPALQSLSVSPATATIQTGQSQQFTATATYVGGATQNVSAQAAWTSSAPAVATVSSTGLASGIAAGGATLSAALGGFSASGALTVQAAPPAPLAITTASLPDGLVGTAYSASLTATGGTPPYTWSIPAGLPPGIVVNGASGAVTGTPTAEGAYAFTVTATDAASAVASRTLSITVTAPSLARSIWPDTAAPTVASAGPDSPVTLGVKFRSDVAGYITGIRYYKSASNTGTHVGSLWSSSGTRLAQATFSGESATGWQTVRFATPVAIVANTTYVASYHTTVGNYAADQNYFTAAGFDSPPLHALRAGVSGANGVFRYGATPTFPNTGFRDTNYWVDVVFSPTATPATLQSVTVTPANSSLAVGSTRQLTATARYSDGSTANMTSSATWSTSDGGIASVAPGGLLTAFNAGTVTVGATVSGVTGSTSATVTPGTPPAPEGPGGPVLVITHAANPFTRYLAEILKAEGLNAFRAVDVASVTPAVLAGYEVAILGEFPLTSAHVTMLTSWVNAGGNLVAMRPDRQLASLLGLTAAGTTVSEGYLLVNTATSPGAGIVGETMQFHGTADRYTLAGATAVATLYTSPTAATTSPAVSLRTVGLGRAAAFAYDLARSVAYTRQGNPAWSGQERDGRAPIRSDDLYFGGTSSDWVNLAKVQIPQADEQQRLLVNLMGHMNAGRTPLPRFWYFPSGHKAVVVMTGDDHANAATLPRMQSYLDRSTPGCSVDDWECIRSSSYVYPQTGMLDRDLATYQSLGFEIGVHVTTGCQNWTSQASLDATYASEVSDFLAAFPSALPPTTSRTHCIVWSDYDSQPQVELAHGIRLDTNYYYWPGPWVLDRPGFMTGSGIPMRFVTRTGQLVDVYQAATQMTDESDQTFPFTIDRLLDAALGPLGYYAALTANMHTDAVESPGSDAIVESAQARGVPIVSARQLLTWLDGRDASSFVGISWAGGVLTFDVAPGTGARNLRAMLPTSAGGVTLSSVRRNGTDVPFTLEAVKGVGYAMFPATAGSYTATYR